MIKVRGGTCVRCRQIIKKGTVVRVYGGLFYHPNCYAARIQQNLRTRPIQEK